MTLTSALRAITRPDHTAYTRAMESLSEAEAQADVDALLQPAGSR